MADRSIVRNAQYRRGGLSIRQRHNERQNTDYMNGDIIKDRAEFNVHFKKCEGSYEQAFDKMIEAQTISTRGLGKDPHIVDELVFDVNTAYFENHGGYEYAKSFFEEAYRCAVEEIGGEQFVLSAVLHADERNKAVSEQLGRDVYHYHLHVVYVPVVQKEIYFRKNNKDPELAGKLKEVITQVSHSKKWPKLKQLDKNGEVKRNSKGKAILVNSYSLLQDHFYEHMREAGFSGFERGERGSTAEHLNVLEYKTQKESERAAILDQQNAKKQKHYDVLEKKTAVAKEALAMFSDIDRIGEKKGWRGDISVSLADWKTVSNFAKEGIKSRTVISDLKQKISRFTQQIEGYKKSLEKYEGMGITDTMLYYEAKQRAPRRLADIVADILCNPPEQVQQKTHTISRSTDLSR